MGGAMSRRVLAALLPAIVGIALIGASLPATAGALTTAQKIAHLQKTVASLQKQVKSLLVADDRSRKLTDARMAVWVIGGAKSGVMTTVPKWAFAVSSDAQKFVKENGGRVSTFNEALDMAVKENE